MHPRVGSVKAFAIGASFGRFHWDSAKAESARRRSFVDQMEARAITSITVAVGAHPCKDRGIEGEGLRPRVGMRDCCELNGCGTSTTTSCLCSDLFASSLLMLGGASRFLLPCSAARARCRNMKQLPHPWARTVGNQISIAAPDALSRAHGKGPNRRPPGPSVRKANAGRARANAPVLQLVGSSPLFRLCQCAATWRQARRVPGPVPPFTAETRQIKSLQLKLQFDDRHNFFTHHHSGHASGKFSFHPSSKLVLTYAHTAHCVQLVLPSAPVPNPMASPAGAVAVAYIDELSWLTPRTSRKGTGRAAEQQAFGVASLAQKKRYDRVRRLLDDDEDEGPGASCEATPLSRPPARLHGRGEGIIPAGHAARDESRSDDNGVCPTASAHLASSRTSASSEVKEWIRASNTFEDLSARSSLEPAAPAALAGGEWRGAARSSIGALIVQDAWAGAFYVAEKAAGRCDQKMHSAVLA